MLIKCLNCFYNRGQGLKICTNRNSVYFNEYVPGSCYNGVIKLQKEREYKLERLKKLSK